MRNTIGSSVIIVLCTVATSCSRSDSGGLDRDPQAPVGSIARGTGPALTPDLLLLREETRTYLKQLGAPVEDLDANLDAVTAAALQGDYSVDAFGAILDSFASSSEEADKATSVLYLYADSVMAGYPLDQVEQEPGVEAVGSLALCNTCTTPSSLATATASCQFASGNTTSACPSDFYTVNLPANSQCVFTMCTATCSGATASYDTRIRVRTPSSCTINVDNDDSCGLLSQAAYNTGAAAETKIIEVTGFTTSNFGTYTMGYRCTPVAPCTGGTCAAPSATLAAPTSACQCRTQTTTSGCASTFYNIPLTAGLPVQFTMCPATCAGATANYDTRIRSDNPSCAVTGDNDDFCGLQSQLTVTPTVTGTHRVEVTGFTTSNVGTSTMCWRLPSCTAASVTSITPTAGNTDATRCAKTQTFTAAFQSNTWTAPSTVTWSITPPAGGSASPASGTISLSSAVSSTTFSSTLTRGNCPQSGNFTVTVSATNSCGTPTSTRTITYTLSDTTPPVIVPAETTPCLWPPNHKFVCRAGNDLGATATDNCGPPVSITADSCLSSEPSDGSGDGTTNADCVFAGEASAQQICMRAERSGTNPLGRTYSILGRAQDACGNVSPPTLISNVDVPHDQSEHPEGCIAP
jgi:hypothetical protein